MNKSSFARFIYAGSKYIVFLISAVFLISSGYASDNYDEFISFSAEKHNVDPVLVKALIYQESKFKEDAVGKSGEMGLMQIKFCAVEDWANAQHFPMPSRDEIFKPELNIEIGTWYLARAIKFWQSSKYKYSVVLGLCEYNAGRRKMKEWLPSEKHMEVDIKVSSTREYVFSILDKYLSYLRSTEVASN